MSSTSPAALGMSVDRIIAHSAELIGIRSPNPPGDVREIGSSLHRYLNRHGLPVEWHEPAPGRVNLIGTIDSGRPGPHVVMNAHIDVFPVENPSDWSVDPYGGRIEDGRLYGRGANDMKTGVATFCEVYRAAYHQADTMRGKLSLLLVCDEENYGPWGSRWVLGQRPDLYGDLLLSSEPSGLGLIRSAERGMVWAAVTFETTGGHGAHVQRAPSALRRARDFMDDLEQALAGRMVPADGFVFPVDQSADYEACVGPGTAEHVRSVTLNFGLLNSGVKVNMQPARARVELDIRIPPGLSSAEILTDVEKVARRSGGLVRVLNFMEPNVSPASDPMVRTFLTAAGEVWGRVPVAGPAPGCSDARLWRERGVPAIGYGPFPNGMGGTDEFCDLHELEITSRVHARVVEKILFSESDDE